MVPFWKQTQHGSGHWTRAQHFLFAILIFISGVLAMLLSGCGGGTAQTKINDPNPSRSLTGQWNGTFTSPPNTLFGTPATSAAASIAISSDNSVSIAFFNQGRGTLFTLQGTLTSTSRFTGTAIGPSTRNPVRADGSIAENSLSQTSGQRQIGFSITIHGSLAAIPDPSADLIFTGTALIGSGNITTPRSINGCVVSFSVGSGIGGISQTSGDQSLDLFVFQQGSLLNQFWGLPIQYDFINDSASPNAFSDSGMPRIHVGRTLFVQTEQAYGDLAVLGILAHEYGHQLQRAVAPTVLQGINQDALVTRQAELEADAFSGFYLAFTQNASWTSIQGYYANTYNSGNYDYTNPGWHGSSQNRLDATLLGVNTALYASSNGVVYSLPQLHDIFYNVTYRSIHGGRATYVFISPPEQHALVIRVLDYLSQCPTATELEHRERK